MSNNDAMKAYYSASADCADALDDIGAVAIEVAKTAAKDDGFYRVPAAEFEKLQASIAAFDAAGERLHKAANEVMGTKKAKL
jgi:isopropylmalate/homocitrate/citramalate synthase